MTVEANQLVICAAALIAQVRKLQKMTGHKQRDEANDARTMTGRAFSYGMLWNALPLHIHQLDSISHFKAQIKIYLFRVAFNDLVV